jgi:hypothetical protein
MACPSGQGLDFEGEGWACVPCPYLVTYGALFDGARACAPAPPATTCPKDMLQEFDPETKAWRCGACGGEFDPYMFAGQMICTPC